MVINYNIFILVEPFYPNSKNDMTLSYLLTKYTINLFQNCQNCKSRKAHAPNCILLVPGALIHTNIV